MQKLAGEITNLLSENWTLMKLFIAYRGSVEEWARAHGVKT